MKIFAVRIGDKYGIEYETYLENKLSDYEIVWIREPYNQKVTLQWNKMWGMQLDTDEPICVIDIDILLVGDYKKIFDYPIKPGQFLAMPGWWREDSDTYEINGGFFKYYPKECKYIYDHFMKDIQWNTSYYIKNSLTTGPVNGEFMYVNDLIKLRLKLKTLPDSWITRWTSDEYPEFRPSLEEKYTKITGNKYLYKDDFHPDIKMVHFTNSLNKPHEWSQYQYYA